MAEICDDLDQHLDLAEFYFDDVINPQLLRERHMRLQSTLVLDGSIASPKSMSTPNTSDLRPTHTNYTPIFSDMEEEECLDDTLYNSPGKACCITI